MQCYNSQSNSRAATRSPSNNPTLNNREWVGRLIQTTIKNWDAWLSPGHLKFQGTHPKEKGSVALECKGCLTKGMMLVRTIVAPSVAQSAATAHPQKAATLGARANSAASSSHSPAQTGWVQTGAGWPGAAKDTPSPETGIPMTGEALISLVMAHGKTATNANRTETDLIRNEAPIVHRRNTTVKPERAKTTPESCRTPTPPANKPAGTDHKPATKGKEREIGNHPIFIQKVKRRETTKIRVRPAETTNQKAAGSTITSSKPLEKPRGKPPTQSHGNQDPRPYKPQKGDEMSRNNFDQLILLSTNLLEGAEDPELTQALDQVGLTAEKRTQLKDLTEACRLARDKNASLLGQKKHDRVRKQTALKDVNKELADLSYLFRLLYRDSSYRTMLAMDPQTSTSQVEEGELNPDADGVISPGDPPVARKRNRSEATIRGRLSQTLKNLEDLPPEVQAFMAEHGWTEERTAKAREKQAAYLQAHTDQLKTRVQYHEHVNKTRKLRKQLERLYRAFSLQIRRNANNHEGESERLKLIAQSFG